MEPPLLLVLSVFLFVQGSSAVSATVQTVTWKSDPDGRGTLELIISCILTFVLCVWSALHLNVPPEGSTLKSRVLERVKWIILGIFAPEVVVSIAFAQYIKARWLFREIQKDEAHRSAPAIVEPAAAAGVSPEAKRESWTMTHCFFTVMGGLTVKTGAAFDEHRRLTLSAEGVRLLSFLGHLPQISESTIKDKSKADSLAKTLVCVQAGWMIVQVIGRLIQHLPVTLLEINTLGHVLCALVLYLLWWSKPFEVHDPFVLPNDDWIEATLALMWMCSPVGAKEGITEARCMRFYPPESRQPEERDGSVTEGREAQSPKPADYTKFSIGSPATRDPRKFLGPVSTIRRTLSRLPSTQLDHQVSYDMGEKNSHIAPEHRIFFELQDSSMSLRHSNQYCRRGYSDCSDRSPLSSFELHRWRIASERADELWIQCQARPSYNEYYFTTSSLGFFMGEIGYLVTHVPNLTSLSQLGHANIHRDHLKSILALAAATYGGLHASAWNEYFVTRYERIAWLTCSLLIGSSGTILWLFFLAKQTITKFDSWALEAFRSLDTRTSRRRATYVGWLTRAAIALFAVARIFLVVEAFVSLRRVPLAVYDTPEWADLIPHL